MTNERIEALKAMVESAPSNVFPRYGLAMEYVKTGDLEHAMTEFYALLGINPDYGAGYFHGAQTLEKLGRVEEACSMYQRGIEATTRTGDAHTRSELQAALDLLG